MREMKDSGVEWIGEIPKDWKIRNLGYSIIFLNGYAFKGNELIEDDGYYVIRIGNITTKGLNLKSCLKYKGDTECLAAYRIISNDIIIAMSGATTGKNFLLKKTDLELYINQRVGIMRSKNDIRFASYILNCNQFFEYIKLLSAGSAQPNISGKNILNYKMPFPPLPIQQAIADYLDTKCSKIDAIIDREHNVIEKLKEYKLSLITEAVTKGLNPDVAMKDSGIEWIGEIPEGWKLRKLNSITKKIIDGTHNTPNYQIDGIPFLRVTDITSSDGINRNIDWDNTAYISIDEHIELAKRCNPQKGDLLVSKNGTIGVPKIINWENVFSIFVSLCLIKVLDIIKVEYLYYYFKSSLIWTEIAIGGRTGTITNLHLEKIKEFRTPLPPISEQTQIANYLDNKCNGIDSAIAKKQLVIDKLIEYKKSLIYELVTGKKEV